MVFSSLLFVFLFLAIHLVVYYFAPRSKRNIVLLIFSLIFYSWGGPAYVFLLIGETAVSWYFALQIEKAREDNRKTKPFLIADISILLGLLGIFKYLTFILANLQVLTGIPKEIPNIVLPIGISFYTFQLLSYVIDVYRADVKAQPVYWKLLLYSSLFHQCIAGPIVRYETVAEEIDRRQFDMDGFSKGIRRFSVGLAKKAILANTCAAVVAELLPEGVEALQAQSTLALWIGIIFFTFEIYFDFSAYSDMAIGMGLMVGFHYLENFNYPYTATSVQDFWRRWHISLSTFFRDYVYIPLGGSRCSTLKYVRNLCVVWFLTGLWHGASWNYILWGLYYLAFLLLERFVIRGRIVAVWNRIYTLFVITVGWTIFKFENLAELGIALKGMFLFGAPSFAGIEVGTQLLMHLFFIVFAIIASTPFGKNLRKELLYQGKRDSKIFAFVHITDAITPVVLLFLSLLALVGDSYNPFLYFQF